MLATDKLVLGTVQFGLTYGVNNSTGKPNQIQIFEILNHAFESGLTTLDTAEAYGDAHHQIGAFHQKYPHKKFKIITKFSADTEANLLDKIETYLLDLNIGQIEILMFHSFDSFIQHKGELDSLLNLKAKGFIKKLGVSVYTNEQIEQLIGMSEVDVIQLPFNLLDNYVLRGEIIAKATQLGKEIHSRSVFLQGLLFLEPNSSNHVYEKLKVEIQYLKNLASENRLSMDEMAMAYCLHQKEVSKVLFGVETLEQLKTNLKLIDTKLPASLIEKIDNLRVNDNDWLNPSLWAALKHS